MIWKLLRRVQVVLATPIRWVVAIVKWVWRIAVRVKDWVVLRAWAWSAIFLVVLKSFFTRTRMSHDNGVATRIEVRFLPRLDLPPNGFFRPDRRFVGRCRFASISYDDDARLVGRAASIKLADTRGKSPLDVLMNTGETVPFNDVRSFWGFMLCTIRGRGVFGVPYMRQDPRYYVASKSLLRAVPETFADLSFHSKVPMTFTDDDGVMWHMKFRMQPAAGETDDGTPGARDLADWAWCWQGIRPGETRDRNYLKNELRRRLESEKPRFRLQVQLLRSREDEQRAVLDAGLTWDEELAPYLDLADVTVVEALDHEESNLTLFSMRHRPDCMGTVAPRSIDDPAGMNYLRELGVWARRARLLGNRLFGMPEPFPDEREGEVRHTPFLHPPIEGRKKEIALPQHEGPGERAARQTQIKLTRESYPIAVPGNMPSYAAELPPAEVFDARERLRMWDDIAGTVGGLGLASIEDVTDRHKTLAVFDRMYPLRPIPAVHARWRTDVEFARQRLIGVNPTMIERCDALPAGFPLRNSLVSGLLDPGRTLKEEIRAGRVFLCDYRLLEGVETADVAYLPAPICAFYQPRNGPLLPLAIQLGQTPDAGPIFTPNDKPWLWLTVKTFAQSADAAYHEVCVHLMRTHLVMETVYLCARRQLAERHPLMELLAPHFKFTLAINQAARESMLVPGGALPLAMAAGYDGSIEILTRSFAEWSFDRYNLHHDLERRGVDARDEDGHHVLADYLYRDDALETHRILDDFVADVIGHFYRSDEDVQNDEELKGWLAELADEGRGNLRGLPGGGSIRDRETLIRFISQLLFHATGEHSAVNNGQYDYFGYVPNVPGAMHKRPPTTRDELSEEWLVEALPGGEQSATQIAMVHLLSEPAEWTVGDYPEGFFQGHREITAARARLHDQLERLSVRIRSRNALREVPYTYLDPRHISNSILI